MAGSTFQANPFDFIKRSGMVSNQKRPFLHRQPQPDARQWLRHRQARPSAPRPERVARAGEVWVSVRLFGSVPFGVNPYSIRSDLASLSHSSANSLKRAFQVRLVGVRLLTTSVSKISNPEYQHDDPDWQHDASVARTRFVGISAVAQPARGTRFERSLHAERRDRRS